MDFKQFFLFIYFRPDTKDGLSDEQVENLLLNEECVVDMLKNVLNISNKINLN